MIKIQEIIAVLSKILSIMSFLILSYSNTFSQNETLFVTITNVDIEVEGKIIVKIFDNDEDWLENGKETNKIIISEIKDSIGITFESLDIDKEYAISVLHDEDDDGELDMSFFPPGPAEGVGVSNNNIGFGPPSWEDAKFIFVKNKEFTIEINY